MEPGNPVVGSTVLRIPAIQSPNFSMSAGTGWAIFQDGTAYFFDITASGSVTSTTLVIDSSGGGIFFYSGIPAFGNLVGSWAEQAGSDAYGNSYTQGIAIGVLSNTEIQIRPDLDAVLVYAE